MNNYNLPDASSFDGVDGGGGFQQGQFGIDSRVTSPHQSLNPPSFQQDQRRMYQALKLRMNQQQNQLHNQQQQQQQQQDQMQFQPPSAIPPNASIQMHRDRNLSTSSLNEMLSTNSPKNGRDDISATMANLNSNNAPLTEQQIALCRSRIALTLEINNELLRFALVATGTCADPAIASGIPQSKILTTVPTGKFNEPMYMSCVKRLHVNIAYLLQINPLSSNDKNNNNNTSPINMFPQILTPPVEVPSLAELYHNLQALFPEVMALMQQQLKKKLQQQQQQSQQPPQQPQQQHQRQSSVSSNNGNPNNMMAPMRVNSPQNNFMPGMSPGFQNASSPPANTKNYNSGFNSGTNTMNNNSAVNSPMATHTNLNNNPNLSNQTIPSTNPNQPQPSNINNNNAGGNNSNSPSQSLGGQQYPPFASPNNTNHGAPNPGNNAAGGPNRQISRAAIYKISQAIRSMTQSGDYSNLRACISALVRFGMAPYQLQSFLGNLGINPQTVAASMKQGMGAQNPNVSNNDGLTGNIGVTGPSSNGDPTNTINTNMNNNTNHSSNPNSNIPSPMNNMNMSNDNAPNTPNNAPNSSGIDEETYRRIQMKRMIQLQKAQAQAQAQAQAHSQNQSPQLRNQFNGNNNPHNVGNMGGRMGDPSFNPGEPGMNAFGGNNINSINSPVMGGNMNVQNSMNPLRNENTSNNDDISLQSVNVNSISRPSSNNDLNMNDMHQNGDLGNVMNGMVNMGMSNGGNEMGGPSLSKFELNDPISAPDTSASTSLNNLESTFIEPLGDDGMGSSTGGNNGNDSFGFGGSDGGNGMFDSGLDVFLDPSKFLDQ